MRDLRFAMTGRICPGEMVFNFTGQAGLYYRAYVDGIDIKTLKDPAADTIGGLETGPFRFRRRGFTRSVPAQCP